MYAILLYKMINIWICFELVFVRENCSYYITNKRQITKSFQTTSCHATGTVRQRQENNVSVFYKHFQGTSVSKLYRQWMTCNQGYGTDEKVKPWQDIHQLRSGEWLWNPPYFFRILCCTLQRFVRCESQCHSRRDTPLITENIMFCFF